MEKEKKEIWIEKLIELLNEYEKEKNPKTEYKWFSSYYKPLCYWFKVPFQWWHDNWEDYSEEIATSKQYWFIKWLVENDKIDRDEIIINSEFMPIAFDRKWEKYEWSEEKQLLMLLSISSSPIDDLISYLK